jgi:hypothetical protein
MDIVSGILIRVNCTRSVVGDKKCGVACAVLDLQGVLTSSICELDVLLTVHYGTLTLSVPN